MSDIPIFENKVVLFIIGIIIGYLLFLFINKNNQSYVNDDTNKICEEKNNIIPQPQELLQMPPEFIQMPPELLQMPQPPEFIQMPQI